VPWLMAATPDFTLVKLDPEVYTTRSCSDAPTKAFSIKGIPEGWRIDSVSFTDFATEESGKLDKLNSDRPEYTAPKRPAKGACLVGHIAIVGEVVLVEIKSMERLPDGSMPKPVKEKVALKSEVLLEAPSNSGGLFQRSIVGYEQAGASAAPTTPRAFLNFFVSQPLGRGNHGGLGPRLRTWVDSRITSVPQQKSVESLTLGGLATGIGATAAELKVNDAVQGIEVMGGIQYRLFADPNKRKIFFDDGLTQTSFSFVASIGGMTPLNPTTSAQAFDVPPVGSDALARLAKVGAAISFTTQKDGKEVLTRPKVAFVEADRERFRQQYYGGFRIQSHFFDATGKGTRTPMRTVDVLLGQNNAVTRDRLSGLVGRIEFFNPISFGGRDVIYVFGSAIFRLGGPAASREALILNPVAVPGNLATADYHLITLPGSNRDLYRFGVGINLSGVLNAAKKK
jgi:hypothetical protein